MEGTGVDIAGSLTAEIPRSLLVVSFGCVVWMMEKAGLDPVMSRHWDFLVLRCAENIARWWMLEHHEWPEEEGHVSFPGEVAMPQGLMPAAIWLGTREYAGILRYGGGEGRFRELEVFGALGDSRSTALYDALSVYRTAAHDQPVWRPLWYRDNFTNWATEILRLPCLPSLARHNLEERENWCGLHWCPYPYVHRVVEHRPYLLLPKHVSVVQPEDPTPNIRNWRIMNLRWGTYLHAEGPKVAESEEEDEEEEEEDEGEGKENVG